jgi:hypothetical protein
MNPGSSNKNQVLEGRLNGQGMPDEGGKGR